MTLITIGDLHGKSEWKHILKRWRADIVVFIGDYFDNLDGISAADQISNFEEIVELKKNDPYKYILLIGNYDYHYLVDEQYSGYQSLHAVDIRESLEKNLKYLQVIYRHEFNNNRYLFSHAGITKTWLKNKTLDEVNMLFRENLDAFKFNGYNPYGDDITQGPLWVRPKSLKKDKIDGYIQVVGHTRQENIQLGEVILIDTMDKSEEVLYIQDGEAKVI